MRTPEKSWLEGRFARQYFKSVEPVLSARSESIKTAHKGDRGDSREKILVEALNDHLPMIARAHQGGAVLDYKDRLSPQVDVIIYLSWSPLLKQSGKSIFLASGCYAAIEVKFSLTKENLRDCFKKSNDLKMFRKFILSLEQHGVYPADLTAESICTGIFAYNSNLKPSKVFEVISEFDKKGFPNSRMPDFICVNGVGCWRRHRVEDIAAFHASRSSRKSGKAKSLKERRREVIYSFDNLAFGRMLETILNYVAYVGPVRSHLNLFIDRIFLAAVTNSNIVWATRRRFFLYFDPSNAPLSLSQQIISGSSPLFQAPRPLALYHADSC